MTPYKHYQMTTCLAHGRDGESCEKREQCARHLAFRQPKFPEGETIVGTGCVQRDHQMFLDVAEGGEA